MKANRQERLATSDVAELMKRPYMRVVVPEDDGSFRAEVLEFPGCLATGETREAALSMLDEVAEAWLEAMLARGQAIPEPMECNDFSGKTVVRMPKSLHRKAAYAAERDGVSLNQFIVNSIAQQVGSASPQARAVGGLHTAVMQLHPGTPLVGYFHHPQFITFSDEGLTATQTVPFMTRYRERTNA